MAIVENRETERCAVCGELLHPYPVPEYWMQYPLPECMFVDGLNICERYRKPECLNTYLDRHPTIPVGKAAVLRAQMSLF
jgi:hypothetical protein